MGPTKSTEAMGRSTCANVSTRSVKKKGAEVMVHLGEISILKLEQYAGHCFPMPLLLY